jgi:hypothetical protein
VEVVSCIAVKHHPVTAWQRSNELTTCRVGMVMAMTRIHEFVMADAVFVRVRHLRKPKQHDS